MLSVVTLYLRFCLTVRFIAFIKHTPNIKAFFTQVQSRLRLSLEAANNAFMTRRNASSSGNNFAGPPPPIVASTAWIQHPAHYGVAVRINKPTPHFISFAKVLTRFF